MAKVLFVDDEESMRVLVGHVLGQEGFEVVLAASGEEGIGRALTEKPDMIILDVMMPGLNGFAVCRALRAAGVEAPVMFLTARGDIVDKGEGFEAGGSDYLVKPFEPLELVLRTKAHLRHLASRRPQADGVVQAGPVVVDVRHHEAVVEGRRIELTAKEFEILHLLASHPGEIFTREQLVSSAWGDEYVDHVSSLPVFIRKIREKIEENPSQPRYLVTVRNVGYKLDVYSWQTEAAMITNSCK